MPDAPHNATQQTAIQQTEPLLQAGHHIAAPADLLAQCGEHIDGRGKEHRKQPVLQQITESGDPQLTAQSLGVHLAAVGGYQPAAGKVQPGGEHGKIQHRTQQSEHRRAEPCRQPEPPLALHLPADAGGLAQECLLHQQNRQQRAEHGNDERQLIQHSVILLQKCYAAADLAKPRHAESKQEVQAEALFFFDCHTNFTAVP